ncbi:Serine threonine-kinase SRPK [Hyphodiscus hymeniophilus]|uniref:Serine threonine-kinase SRPK n=1 Tax=Hyphodiscus hymeniophilus TaxID=353542 RepID=A0A9P6VEQ4_9HELO|nr:Serine threonine-kinase SRPK [Hyphodiscus hymeniophilus]
MSSDLSLPRSEGSTVTMDEAMVDVETNGLHLELAPFRLEHIYDYEPGGHHPVHLGDAYGNDGRYRVIHKLGHGGFANVWLCRDTKAKEATEYVALKILMAEASSDDCPELRLNRLKMIHKECAAEGDGAEFICLPLEHFKIQGPNGKHIAFVYPVLGPNVFLGLFRASADPDKDLRSVGLQLAKAVDFLHGEGICHGDLTPNNILHRISGLDGLSEDEVLQILGSPVLNPVLNASEERHHESTAPDYLVYPVSWWDVDAQIISIESCLIDFGESFESSQPPADLGIPGPYRSPELILDKEAGFGSDIWALGCSLFEIRICRKLFSSFDDDDSETLVAIVRILGKLPEPWWSTTWEERKRIYKDEVDEQGRVVGAREPRPVKDEPEGKDGKITCIFHPSVAQNARSLLEKIAAGLWYMTDHGPGEDRNRDTPHKEQEPLADLLGRLLEYKPEDRISARDAMEHEWFKL